MYYLPKKRFSSYTQALFMLAGKIIKWPCFSSAPCVWKTRLKVLRLALGSWSGEGEAGPQPWAANRLFERVMGQKWMETSCLHTYTHVAETHIHVLPMTLGRIACKHMRSSWLGLENEAVSYIRHYRASRWWMPAPVSMSWRLKALCCPTQLCSLRVVWWWQSFSCCLSRHVHQQDGAVESRADRSRFLRAEEHILSSEIFPKNPWCRIAVSLHTQVQILLTNCFTWHLHIWKHLALKERFKPIKHLWNIDLMQ